MNPAALAQLLSGPQGPVYQMALNRATLVQLAARRQVGKKTHRLENSIVKRPTTGPNGQLVMLVGSELSYALVHHNGSRPHTIRPRNTTRLVFMGKEGSLVFALSVNHPGTRPNRYLTDNLHLAVGK